MVRLRTTTSMTTLQSNYEISRARRSSIRRWSFSKRVRECTTQIGTKGSCDIKERTSCFEGKGDGHYQLAFTLFKNGVAQPAVKFPTNYSRKRHKSCDSVYMVEPTCPR